MYWGDRMLGRHRGPVAWIVTTFPLAMALLVLQAWLHDGGSVKFVLGVVLLASLGIAGLSVLIWEHFKGHPAHRPKPPMHYEVLPDD
jgi:hypothetical protein